MRRLFLKNLTVAYPGKLGITTDKGQQNTYPLVLDAPTESYETMLLRWQTGVFDVGANPPDVPPPEPEYPEVAFNLQQQLMQLSMPGPTARELALQLTTGVYSAQRLVWAGIPGPLAMYLAESFSRGDYEPVRAVALGLIPAIATLITGGGASAYAPYPAPAGYRWDFVTEDGARVAENNQPVVSLERLV